MENETGYPICFAISLKSKQASQSWEKVQNCLSNTIKTILNNTDKNFIIIVAGHEKPNIPEMSSNKVIWLQVNTKPPKDLSEFSKDKMYKRKTIGAYLRNAGFSGYFLPTDADDWVHCKFVEYVRQLPISKYYIVNKGLFVNILNQKCSLKNNFYRHCGTSTIFYFNNHEFPLTVKKEDVKNVPFSVVTRSHSNVINNFKDLGIDYSFIDFPAIAYILGHGDNISVLKGKKKVGQSSLDDGIKLNEWFYKYFIVN